MQRFRRQLLVAALVALAAVVILYRCEPGADLQDSATRPAPELSDQAARTAAMGPLATASHPSDTAAPTLSTGGDASYDRSAVSLAGEPFHYVKLHFTSRPTADQVRLLRRHGVRVVAFSPPNSLLAGLPAGFDADQIPDLLDQHEPQAADKMGPLTTQLVSGASADEAVLVFAEFYDGVAGDQARRAAAEDGLTILARGGLPENVLLVRGPASAVKSLAGRNTVSLILNAPQRFAESQRDIIRLDNTAASLGDVTLPLYDIQSPGWDGTGLGSASLKYYFGRTTDDASAPLVKAEIVRALNTWAAVVAITWTETSQAHRLKSIDLNWLSSGDMGYPFDGPGGTLARSWYPSPPNPETLAGDIEFDDGDLWEIGNPGSGFDIYSVTLHESGHSLGLGHSENTGSVMYKYLWSSTVYTSLTADDIAGIQSIYAPGPAPTVKSWESLAAHGPSGEVAVVMSGGYVEARSSGLKKIRVTFSRALAPASVGTAPLVITGQLGGSVGTAGCVASLDASGCVLTVTLASALADGDRYTIAAATSLRSVGGVAVAAGQQVTAGALMGDVDGSAVVTSADVLAVRVKAGQAVTSSIAGRDVDNSGTVTGLDMQCVAREMGRSLP